MSERFEDGPSGVAVHLEATEYAVLDRVRQIVGSVGASPSDPAVERLDPAVHRDDPKASGEFSRLAGAEIAEGRSGDAERFGETLAQARETGVVTRQDLECWVRTLGIARLVLAARKGHITDDLAFSQASRSDADLLLVDYLGILQDEIVEVLLAALPDPVE